MKKVMIIFFSIANTENIINRAFELMQGEKDELHLLFLMDETLMQNLSSIMVHVGFLGDKVQREVLQTIEEDYKRRIFDQKNEIEQRAANISVACTCNIIKDEFIKAFDELLNKKGINHLLINYTKDRYMTETHYNSYYKYIKKNTKMTCEAFLDGLILSRSYPSNNEIN